MSGETVITLWEIFSSSKAAIWQANLPNYTGKYRPASWVLCGNSPNHNVLNVLW